MLSVELACSVHGPLASSVGKAANRQAEGGCAGSVRDRRVLQPRGLVSQHLAPSCSSPPRTCSQHLSLARLALIPHPLYRTEISGQMQATRGRLVGMIVDVEATSVS